MAVMLTDYSPGALLYDTWEKRNGKENDREHETYEKIGGPWKIRKASL
jgi:hypothetical protein